MKKNLFIVLVFLLSIKLIYGAVDTFNVGVTMGFDSDGDGLLDPVDPDDDNDGILDGQDCLTGNSSFVNSGTLTINVTVNDQTNLSQQFNGTISVKIMDGTTTKVEFDFDCSIIRLNLAKVTIEKQTGSVGSLFVKGINLGAHETTKTVYIDDLSTTDTLCIKDQEISSISEISSTCDSTGEVSITCSGSSGSYTCIDLGSQYQITGLNNSGVIEYSSGTSPPGGGGGREEPEPEIITDFEVSPLYIKASLLQGESKTESLKIENTGDVSLEMNLEVGLISKYVTLSIDSFSLEPGESKTIDVAISVPQNEPTDAYLGRIVI